MLIGSQKLEMKPFEKLYNKTLQMNGNKSIFKHNIRKVAFKILQRVKENKEMSIDNLAARFFKNDTKHLAEPVTYIFKLLIKLAAA